MSTQIRVAGTLHIYEEGDPTVVSSVPPNGILAGAVTTFTPPTAEYNLQDISLGNGMQDFVRRDLQPETMSFGVRAVHTELESLLWKRGVGLRFEGELDPTWLADPNPGFATATEIRNGRGVVVSVTTQQARTEDIPETLVTLRIGQYLSAVVPVSSLGVESVNATLGRFFDVSTGLHIAGGYVTTATARAALTAGEFSAVDERYSGDITGDGNWSTNERAGLVGVRPGNVIAWGTATRGFTAGNDGTGPGV